MKTRTILTMSLMILATACEQPRGAATGGAPAQAAGQSAPIEFRVVPGDRNPTSCQRWDAALSRVHTFTRTGETATLSTAGGITQIMTQSTPNVFTRTMALGGTSFNVVADASKTPGTLEVTEPRIGCRWIAVAR